MEAYEKALERLKPEEREAIIVRVELGYSYGELAVTLDKPSAEGAQDGASRRASRIAVRRLTGRARVTRVAYSCGARLHAAVTGTWVVAPWLVTGNH